MAKLTLTDLSSLTNESSAVAAINANNALIETALENTLSLDGTTPNSMNADLDMNSNDILNGGAATFSALTVGATDFSTIVSDVQAAEAAATASAAAAAASEAAAASAAAAADVAKITWRGPWSGVTSYAVSDAVEDGGVSYICTSSNTNQQPPNASYWDVLADKGGTGATGATGSAGATGATGAAGTSFTWKGAWSGATAYVVNDNVSSGGSSYICILGHTNQVPPNGTYWELLAQKGTDGAGAGDMLKADNLSGLANLATSRANLGSTTVGDAVFIATDASAGRTALGAGSIGNTLFIATAASNARNTIGSTTIGDALFIASAASNARNTLGSTAVGDALFIASNATSARSTLGSGTTGDALFLAANATSARTTLSLGTAAIEATGTSGATIPFLNTANTWSGTQFLNGVALNGAKGADIASATTTDIGAASGNYVDVTGTTTITGLGTVQAGTTRTVRFTGALTLTHNATSLILPGGANITTAANDRATFISLGSGNWICVQYTKADGTSVVAGASSSGITLIQANSLSTSSTCDFTTGISSTYKSFMLTGAFTHSTSSTGLVLSYSTNGGSSWSADAHTRYAYVYTTGGASVNQNGASDGQIASDVNSSNDVDLFLTLSNLSGASTRKVANGWVGYIDSAADVYTKFLGINLPTSSAINGLRLAPSSGTMTGKVSLWGVT